MIEGQMPTGLLFAHPAGLSGVWFVITDVSTSTRTCKPSTCPLRDTAESIGSEKRKKSCGDRHREMITDMSGCQYVTFLSEILLSSGVDDVLQANSHALPTTGAVPT